MQKQISINNKDQIKQPKQQLYIQKTRIKIVKFIPKAYRRTLKLIRYIIGISEARKANQIIQILKQFNNEKEPMAKGEKGQSQKQVNERQIQYPEALLQKDNLKLLQDQRNKDKQKLFLKRIRKVQDNMIEVIICKFDHELKDILIQKLNNLNLILKTQVKQLPQQAPLTKQQFEQWSKIWPINFIRQQIIKEVVHSEQAVNLLGRLHKSLQNNKNFYLLDSRCQKILCQQQGQCRQNTIKHPIMDLLSKWPSSQPYISEPNKYYYLTSLKMFINKQICGMCSMALVHSRLNAIYLNFHPTQTMDQIMACPKLNHQINIFLIQQ